jgi:hypothetical protein
MTTGTNPSNWCAMKLTSHRPGRRAPPASRCAGFTHIVLGPTVRRFREGDKLIDIVARRTQHERNATSDRTNGCADRLGQVNSFDGDRQAGVSEIGAVTGRAVRAARALQAKIEI